jgi:hypothetical protein
MPVHSESTVSGKHFDVFTIAYVVFLIIPCYGGS